MKTQKIIGLFFSFLLCFSFIACEIEDPHVCSEKLSGHFEVNDLENYPALLYKIDGNKENYIKRTAIKYADIDNFRIIGQFKTSNYGIISSDCIVEHGDLGCEELTSRITITDIATNRSIVGQSLLSEVYTTSSIKDSVSFDVYYPEDNEKYTSNTLINNLNHEYYRMMLPNYIIQIRYGLVRKEYEYELKYQFASTEYIDTIRFKIE